MKDPGPFQFTARTSAMFLKRTSPCVYFLQEGEGGPIKIGRTNADCLDSRMTMLQIGNPRELRLVALVCMGGSRHVGIREEGRIHKHFAEWRIRGEWFNPCESLLSLISEYAAEKYGGQLRDILKAALLAA